MFTIIFISVLRFHGLYRYITTRTFHFEYTCILIADNADRSYRQGRTLGLLDAAVYTFANTAYMAFTACRPIPVVTNAFAHMPLLANDGRGKCR